MDGTLIVYDKERDDAAFVPEEKNVRQGDHDGSESDHTPLHVNKSVNSKNQKANPVASWKISNHRINGFAFSPDSRHLAVVSEDGSLRIINYLQEQSVDSFLHKIQEAFTDYSPIGSQIYTQATTVDLFVSVGRRMENTS